jgi:multiple sugar transport system substrate-binding protein
MLKKVSFSLLSSLLVLILVLSGCQSTNSTGSTDSGGSSKKEITVWSFTDEGKYAVKKFEEKYPDVKVNFKHIPGDQYDTKLRSALQTGVKAPDVFALENGVVRKFIDNPALENLSDYNADELIQQQYEYVQATEKDSKGNVKVIGYQGTPGGIYYRRDLAKEYLGTDDPAKVSEMISSWDKLFEIGQRVEMESNGEVHALSNWNAINTVQGGNVTQAWVVDEKLVIDPERLKVLDLGKTAQDKNVVAQLEDWSPAMNATMQTGEIMFYPGPTWYLQYVLKANAPDTSGLWGLAHGPGSFYGGGTFYAIYNKSENKELAWEFINFYSFDHDFLKQLAKEQSYFTSNRDVNAEMAPTLTSDFLGGQKYFEFFGIEAEKIPSFTRTKYDGDIDAIWGENVQSFMKGNIKTKDELITKFKKDVKHDFPELEVE